MYFIKTNYDNIFSYIDTVSFSSLIDNEFIPIYVNVDQKIELKSCVNIYVTNETVTNKLVFSVYSSTPKNRTFLNKKTGLIATTNKQLANVNDLVIDNINNEEILIRGKDSTTSMYTYTWTKTVENETWYARGYVTVEYGDGTTETFYSPNIVSAHK